MSDFKEFSNSYEESNMFIRECNFLRQLTKRLIEEGFTLLESGVELFFWPHLGWHKEDEEEINSFQKEVETRMIQMKFLDLSIEVKAIGKLGEYIRDCRRISRLSLRLLAVEANINPRWLALLEDGLLFSIEIDQDKIDRISKVLAKHTGLKQLVKVFDLTGFIERYKQETGHYRLLSYKDLKSQVAELKNWN
jgi:hypothetical protein